MRAGDSERLRILFLAGFTRPDAGSVGARDSDHRPRAGRATGDCTMVELLLEFGADPNKKNAGGFGPIQSLWQFWGPTHAADRMTQRDEQKGARRWPTNGGPWTCSSCCWPRAPTRTRCRRKIGKCALMEAVKRGPVQAVCALLQYGADESLARH